MQERASMLIPAIAKPVEQWKEKRVRVRQDARKNWYIHTWHGRTEHLTI